MKYRKDFVTNSSSSSFVCEICGNSASGWDLCLADAEMCNCKNGHTFCVEHLLDKSVKSKLVKYIMSHDCRNGKSESELFDIDECELWESYITDGGYWDVPEDFCPICQFIEYSEDDLCAYLLKEYGVDKEIVFDEIKKLNRRRRKLYNSEYITYICKKFNLNPSVIVSTWKSKYGSYENFKKEIQKISK